MLRIRRVLLGLPDEDLPKNVATVNKGINKYKLKVLYTNADQFLNKRDHLLVHIAGNTPDIIVISEMLPKASQAVINLSLITLPGYHNYLNFDPDNYNPTLTNIRGVGIFVHHKLQASQIYFNTPHFEDHVWANIKLQGPDSLLRSWVHVSIVVLQVILIPAQLPFVVYLLILLITHTC